MYMNVLRDTKRTLNKVDISQVIIEGKQNAPAADASVKTDMQKNKVREWSYGDDIEATEEIDAPESKQFD